MLTRKIKLWDINAHITCRLCSGYLIDATTVTECLHTFCRSCLVKYLEENNTCPTCRIVIHQSHPLQYIGHDRTMQDIVYKLVPGLQEAEMRKQREFYHKLGMEVPGDIKGETCSAKQHLDSHRNGETKADDSSNKEAAEEKPEEDNDYHRSDEQVSICLECNSSKLRGLKRKWIRCSAQATVLHLKKFIAKKLNLSSFNEGWFLRGKSERFSLLLRLCLSEPANPATQADGVHQSNQGRNLKKCNTMGNTSKTMGHYAHPVE
ncbi:polycomb group RING finger protein 3 isoform X2 [Sapajus apella]|uniref:Polycomb group RING finger protein 3 isoform X2 n=1 Tax=Sapajus apella TaxID=9515 RepID=A0A6J3FVE6_SAPAP|nr:polycomb group RING finger protein 3 isoform X2 [Sapajus apella]